LAAGRIIQKCNEQSQHNANCDDAETAAGKFFEETAWWFKGISHIQALIPETMDRDSPDMLLWGKLFGILIQYPP